MNERMIEIYLKIHVFNFCEFCFIKLMQCEPWVEFTQMYVGIMRININYN